MLDLLQRCFPEQLKTDVWQEKLKEMIPSYGQVLANNPQLGQELRKHTSEVLGLGTFEYTS